jgi:WD40 repeat protein/serine/threonine protein kinase
MSELEGKRIKAYELEKAVGSGGFGTVYKAKQDVILREVAIKVIREKYANQPQFIKRFETEARIIARLEHPHIVPLYDYWREPDGAYLIMRWLQGGSLRDKIKEQGSFAPALIVAILNQIAAALSLAHSRDIIHRDIKPENILMDDQGNAYLTDFGIAIDLLHADDSISLENMSYGSPEYVAPETLLEKKVSPQSDIYSLGIMLYELLANARPFSGASTQEIVKMQVRNPVPSLKLMRPDLPPEIDTIIWQATAKKPAARYDNVLALAYAFQQVAADIRDVPPQFRMISRQRIVNAEPDLSTGKMTAAMGTTDLATGNLSTAEVSSDFDLATADLSGLQPDVYGTADLSGIQPNAYATDDLSSVQADAYGTGDLGAPMSPYETGDLRGDGSWSSEYSDAIDGQNDPFATGNLILSMGTQALIGHKPPNPYKGLNAFQEEDTSNFYGREEIVERLIQSLRNENKRFLAIVGSSGSGKSSLVRAGLVPAMRRGRIAGSHEWYITTMVPGNDPFESLTEALLQVAVSAPKNWGAQLRDRVDGLHTLVSALIPEEDAELVLFIDQFEEVFTLLESEETRQKFLGALYYALVAPVSHRRLRLIVTLRADYLDRPLNYPEFGELLRQNTEVILPLSEKDLEAAIRRPIEDNRGLIADNLVSAILEEVRHQPGALPLVQYALTQMYDRAEENTLNYALYDAIGGVSGALAQSASKIYDDLTEYQQAIARQLFMRLVALGDDARATRRRALWSDLVSGIEDRKTADIVINTFGAKRLLTLDNDPVTRAPTVDIAHEALIEKWDKFQEWISQNRADLQRRQQLSRAVDEWETSERKADYLAKGSKLGELESLLYSNTLVLSQEEREYLEASQELRLQEERRTRNWMITLGVLAVVAGIMAVIAVIGQVQANEQRQVAVAAEGTAVANEQIAIEEAQVSQSRALAANAISNIENTDLSLLISIEAVTTERTYEALNSLLTGIQTPFLQSYLHGHTDAVRSVAYSPDGTMIASADEVGVIYLWDGATRQPLGESLIGHEQAINRVLFSPDGRFLASASEDATVRLWSMPDGEEIYTFTHPNPVWAIDFSPNGRFLVSTDSAASAEMGNIRVWNMQSGEEILTLENAHDEIIYDVVYSPDGSLIASGGGDNLIRLWNAETGENLVQVLDTKTGETVDYLSGHTNWVLTLAFSSDGSRLFSSGVDNNIGFWDVAEQRLLGYIQTRHLDWVRDIAVSSDDRYIVTASHDNTVKVWTIEGQAVGSLNGHTNRVLSVDFQPETYQIVTGSADNDIALWQIVAPQHPGSIASDTRVVAETLSITDDRQRLMVFDTTGAIQVLNPETNSAVFMQSGLGNGLTASALSADGTRLVASGSDGKTIVFDVISGARLSELTGHPALVSALLFTPDGLQIISADNSGAILRWNTQDFSSIPTQLQGSEDGVTSMAISHNGQYLAVSGRDTNIKVWDLTTETVIAELQGHENVVNTLIFNQDDTRLISGGRDNQIIIWDFMADEALQRRLIGHTDFVLNLAISPNNRYLASAGLDNSVRLWDLETARPLGLPLTGHQQRVTGVAFLDDETLLSTGHDGFVLSWDLNVDNWLQAACEMSNRRLTNLEWAQFIQTDNVSNTCAAPESD